MVRIITLNGITKNVSEQIIKNYISINLYPNPFWTHSKMINETEMISYLEGNHSVELIKKITRYFLAYTENILFSGYILAVPSEESMIMCRSLKVISALRELYAQIEKNKHAITDGILGQFHCLMDSVGIDPM